jgi:imidazolonepropionase-like amidohydrolase
MFKPLLLAAALAAALPAMAAITLIRDVRMFDGQRAYEHRNVLIDGAKIADPDFRGQPRADTIIVEGKGRTLLPGLIDAHVHAYRYLDLPPLFGVTTQIDMFTAVSVVKDVTAKMNAGQNSQQADIFSAGTLVTAPGGHGTEYGMKIPTLTGKDDAQSFVDARIAEGSHFIKVVLESGRKDHPMNSLDLETVKAVIDAAHRRGKLAVVHISNADAARAALKAGADGLAHLFVGTAMSKAELSELVALAVAHKAFVIPTFSILDSIAGLQPDDIIQDPSLMALLDKEQVQPLKAAYALQGARPELLAAPRQLTAALHKAGVPLLAGTDAGNVGTQYGISMHHELAALVAAGLTPQQALEAATSAPARAFGLGQRGRIAKAYKADLLLVDGNPTEDIGASRRIAMVWKDGVELSVLRATQRDRVLAERNAVQQGVPLPPDGRISLFSPEKLGSPLGLGWTPSTDRFMGGASSVQLAQDASTPEGHPAVTVSGTVAAGFPYPWSGLAMMPGAKPMQPVDLSNATAVRFRVRGDGKTYHMSMMSKGVSIPANASFVAQADWQEVTIPFSALRGVDASMATMLSFNAGPQFGDYRFQIADIRLVRE